MEFMLGGGVPDSTGATVNTLTNDCPDLGKPIIVVYNPQGRHWVVFSILKHNNKVILLYKDSLGGKCPEEVKDVFNFYVGEGKSSKKINTSREQAFFTCFKTDLGCGIYALANLKIIYDSITSRNTEVISQFINDFNNYKGFCGGGDAVSLRKDVFAKTYASVIYNQKKTHHIKNHIKKYIINEVKNLNPNSIFEIEEFKSKTSDKKKIYLEIIDILIDNGKCKYQYLISSLNIKELKTILDAVNLIF